MKSEALGLNPWLATHFFLQLLLYCYSLFWIFHFFIELFVTNEVNNFYNDLNRKNTAKYSYKGWNKYRDIWDIHPVLEIF